MDHREPSPVRVDAAEYALLLYAANDELNWGADVRSVLDAADELAAACPDHVLVKLLRAKAQRMSGVERLVQHRRGTA